MQFILLTHPRERLRATNTGQLVLQALGERAQVIEWHRKQPDAALLAAIEAARVGLVFPTDEPLNMTVDSAGDLQASTQECAPPFEYLLLIDATWQEARKMYNQSPYLKSLAKVGLQPAHASIYPLRRNQLEGGLCTAECVVLLLKKAGELELAQQLIESLMEFIKR
ncbi:DTW domain-containing protein [Shewanella basaltis]|uniref:DTW domain-containing protein n=1 Tax=Shewanella basaltis TaxID=472183 RepID=UPI00200CA466|nr:DTW domain-containing protein [Shewanella basaltis]